jgi:hypothetical protein
MDQISGSRADGRAGAGTSWSLCRYRIMKQRPPTISERKAAVIIWIGTIVFAVGAMLFGR